MTHRHARFLLYAWFAAAAPARGQVPPQLAIAAPPALEPVAARLRAFPPQRLAASCRLVGLVDPGAPIRVVLIAESAPLARQVPPWVAGFADPGAGVVVLFPARSPSYPDSSLEDVLRHEVAHVLVGRAAGGRPLPRWFQEGMAMIAGLSWGLEERSRLSLALLADDRVPLAALDDRFHGSAGTVARAYTLAGAFVRDLVERHGPGIGGAILSGVAQDLSFDEAFQRAAGETLAAAEGSFWTRQTFWYRWVPLLTSSVTLWLGVTMLALWAMRRRRARDAAQRRLWEEEDRRAAPEAARSSSDEWVN